MPTDAAILVGVLVACAVHLVLHGSFVRLLFGFVLLSHAANLIVLSMSGDPSGRRPPIWAADEAGPMVDPLPQALVLTAIVINFSLTAYLVVLLYRLFLDLGTANADQMPGDKPDAAP